MSNSIEIDFKNSIGSKKFSKDFFFPFADLFKKELKIKNNIHVSLVLVGSKEIKLLNKQYRNKDEPTDVLSFPLNHRKISKTSLIGDILYLGDIFIALPMAKENAKEYRHSLEEEMGFLFVHSLLHLAGYDHINSDNERRKMFSLQNSILEKMKIKPDIRTSI